MTLDPRAERTFFAVCALLFIATAAVTIVWCRFMTAMGGMRMPGGGTMSMAWMQMPGQTWLGGAASFLGMWIVMMAAMMLPCLVPMLRRYRHAICETTGPHLGWLTTLAGTGYFFVWTAFGTVSYALGLALTSLEMRQVALARAVPIAAGAVVLIAGVFQFTRFKAHHLSCCLEKPECGQTIPADAAAAWRHGLRLGLDCSYCCAGLMAILLMMGVMNLGAMAVVAALINVERFAPAPMRVVRVIGALVIASGLFLIARAAGIA